MAATEARTGTRNRAPLLAVLVGSAISLVGNNLTLLAVPWFVLQTTGSAARTGLAGVAAVLPIAVASFLGGPIVDRLGYRRASVLADLGAALAIAAIPLLADTVGLAYWQLLALVFLAGLLDAPGGTARQGLIPALTTRAAVRLERANAAFGAITRGAQLLGAPLAGVLIAIFGPRNVLWLDATSFLASALLVAGFVPPTARLDATAGAERAYLANIVEGLRFIRGDALIVTLLAFVATTNLLGASLLPVILPVYAARTLHSAVDLGVLIGVFGVGALAGAVLYGAFGAKVSRRALFLSAFVVNAGAVIGLGVAPGFFWAIGAMLVLGLSAGPLNPLLMTLLHERVATGMFGRVFSLLMALSWVTMPVGLLLGGGLLERFGVGTTLLVLGGTQLAIAVAMTFSPALRRMDRLADAGASG